MKQIPPQLLARLKERGRSMCYMIRIASLTSDAVCGFTTLDAPITFDDGAGEMDYSPLNTLEPQNIQSTTSMDVDNTEAHGWFEQSVLTAIDAGVYTSGEATIYRVCYQAVAAGAEVVFHGMVGKVAFETNQHSPRKIEIKGLDNFLKVKKNDQYSITCRNTFGDKRCGMPLAWESAEVAEVADGLLLFRVTGSSHPAEYFDFGVIRFDSGDNAGAQLEVERWDGEWVRLSFATPYPVSVGDVVSLRRDCNKFAITCSDTYHNIINFNGEHLTPVQDQSLMIPGAYIKSQGAL